MTTRLIDIIKPYRWEMEWRNPRWFGLGGPIWMPQAPHRTGHVYIRPWNLFRRVSVGFHQWGVGLVQIGGRHLVFISRMDNYDGKPYWTYSFLFLHDTHKQER